MHHPFSLAQGNSRQRPGRPNRWNRRLEKRAFVATALFDQGARLERTGSDGSQRLQRYLVLAALPEIFETCCSRAFVR